MHATKKNRRIYTLLLAICMVGFWLFENFYSPSGPTDSKEPVTTITTLLPQSTTGVVVNHNYYTLSYSEAHEQAEWVAYVLERGHLTYDNRKRPFFIEDPKVGSRSADWRNYKGSGYDRGHLCPAGDRRFSEAAFNETFYTSNISPQDRDFNAGVWNRLEKQVRYWAKKEGPLFVVTGGVLEGGLPSIGEEEVTVPKFYYKIVAKGNGADLKVLAFLFPHRESNAKLSRFVVPVDEVEALTGIDFFPELPDTQETKLEAAKDLSTWKF
ncbi:DNA/RNA non-specific endonuclease [Arenibacter sp. 6A1]|uniref:DNA/RNA non-specific endonuclease n=1 Tax=Arenibacter sp. 6A1 TaxID=2720391 RepID=UPI0014452078|nr:DNA/RNA non-specific endonuclease [Arenibacter sp. 6A1]NKI26054.1 DNA/RNA non-specific endonuclease [Arenibacter sp. 6A1]